MTVIMMPGLFGDPIFYEIEAERKAEQKHREEQLHRLTKEQLLTLAEILSEDTDECVGQETTIKRLAKWLGRMGRR